MTMSGTLLLLLLAAPPPAGAGASVVVEAGTGRVAIARASRIAVYDGFLAPAPTATFDAPDGPLDLLEFRAGKLVYRFVMPETGAETFACVLADDGREVVVFPNDGIGVAFPTAGARLTLDGKGLYQTLGLDAVARAEFGIPADVPDGAGVVATYRFAGEKVAARFSADFDAGLALTAGDLLITVRRGGLLRYRAGEGVAWRLDADRKETWRVLDVDPAARVAVVLEGAAALVGRAVADGVELWRLDLGEPGPAWEGITASRPVPVVDARVLRDGRVLVLGRARPFLTVFDPARSVPVGGDLLQREAYLPMRERILAEDASLAGVGEVAAEQGPALLLGARQGFAAAPLP
jgi:hypothetical protein